MSIIERVLTKEKNMNKYISTYMNLKIRLYRQLIHNHSHPDRVFEVNWMRHYHSMESQLKLKNIADKKLRVY
ncbi:MAG: hypothetical protein EPN82_16210 [Bacteroidetes bacterium]|nr:MAG: hypothetical protein EPN82_16210 [Bacteroidota bacterium]